MKKILKRTLYAFISLIAVLFIVSLILAFLPTKARTNHVGISPDEAAELRQNFTGKHHQFTTTDGETLFLRRWDPEAVVPAKKDIAILIFHGFTAHSGAYSMAGVPLSEGGYTTFGLDYRGHGLSGGNRGDSPGKERWFADLAESVMYIKSLGYPKVVILGHSLGVASAMCATIAIPEEVSGLVLLSGAYEGRKGLSKPLTLFQKVKILSSSLYRPSFQVIENHRDGAPVSEDPLFTYKYTLRFVTMLDVTQLRLPEDMNIPVLVGAGDIDELFEVEKVKEFYDLIPGNKKEFWVMKNTNHANITVERWEEIVQWLNKNFESGAY